ATAGSDYTATAGTVSWNPSETGPKTFTAAMTDDAFDEPDETVVIMLSNGVNATISDSAGVLNIIDDDVPLSGDVNLDRAVDILDLILVIDQILERTTLTQRQFAGADVYPLHATPDLQGPPDGVVDASDLVLIQNAILDGAWYDGTLLKSGEGSLSKGATGLSTQVLASGTEPPQISSDEVLVTFEVYHDFVAVRLTNLMPVKGLQLNLSLTVPVSSQFETKKFQRASFMDAPSKVVNLRHTMLVFNQQNKTIEPGDGYILFIKGDWSAYDIPGTDIIAGAQQGNDTTATSAPTVIYQWVQGQILPTMFKLEQNYPNPFNPSTTIQFQLAEFAKVKIAILDILGRHIKTLVKEEMDPGAYSLVWDGTDASGRRVASGVYLYRMRAGDFIRSKKMLLVK
ncbi:MAG: FlgD immunoglobulin-like domain containing protein, partial [Bacteroidota bacterium]